MEISVKRLLELNDRVNRAERVLGRDDKDVQKYKRFLKKISDIFYGERYVKSQSRRKLV